MTLPIIVDTREQRPFTFTGYPAEVTRAKLETGDYSLAGYEHLVAVERKQLSDLVSSLTTARDRFEAELRRSSRLDYFSIIVEAPLDAVLKHRYRSQALPHSILQSCIAFSLRYGTSFQWAGSRDGAEYLTFWTLARWLKEREAQRLRLMTLGLDCEKARLERLRESTENDHTLVEA